jgi:O-antigen/teichoic acid export membrane protein
LLRNLLDRWLRPGSLVSHALSLGGGTALGQLVVIAASPVLTRLFSPEEFGVFGLFSSFLAVAAVAACWRLDFAIVSSRTDRQAASLLLQSVTLLFPNALLAGVALWLMQHNGILAYDALSPVACLAMAVAVIVTGMFGALRFWSAREMRFSAIGQAVLRQSLGRAGAPIALGAAGTGWEGLVGGEIIGRSLGIFHLARPAILRCSSLLARCRIGYHLKVLRRNWKFPSILLPSSLLDAIAGALPLPFIAVSFGPAAAGSFALVTRLASVPGALVAASLADVFQSHFGRDLRQNNAAAYGRLMRTAGALLAIGLLVFVPLGLLGPWLVPLVFGSEWREAGLYLQILAPLFLAAFVVSPLSRAIAVANRQELKLIIDVALLLVPIATLYALRSHGWSAALIAFSAANVVVYIAYFALIVHAARHPAWTRRSLARS